MDAEEGKRGQKKEEKRSYSISQYNKGIGKCSLNHNSDLCFCQGKVDDWKNSSSVRWKA